MAWEALRDVAEAFGYLVPNPLFPSGSVVSTEDYLSGLENGEVASIIETERALRRSRK